MPNYFQNVYFSRHSLHIGLVLDLVLFQDLDGYFLSSENVRAQAHLPEGTLPEGPTFALGKFKERKEEYLPTM